MRNVGKKAESKPTDNPYEMSEAEKKAAMNDPRTRMSQKYDALMRTKAGTPEREKALNEYIKERDSFKESQGAEAAKEYPIDPTGNAEVGLHEGGENMPRFAQSYKLLSEEHDQDALESNAKLYPELQPLVKQRDPFVKKRIAAYTKLRDNPNNPKARADFVDASNAINQIDADIDRAYKKATAGDSSPRELTGDCKIRVRR